MEDLPQMPTEPLWTRRTQTSGTNGWRDILQSGGEYDDGAGVSLEHLIDLQRSRARRRSDRD